jgi:hypothetical protein
MKVDPLNVHLGDTAITQQYPASIRQGVITMISLRGINVKDDFSTRFVKWENVKGIRPRSNVHDVEEYYKE